ncbi:hypothetical protein [Paenibacillus sp. FSL K6-0108]
MKSRTLLECTIDLAQPVPELSAPRISSGQSGGNTPRNRSRNRLRACGD